MSHFLARLAGRALGTIAPLRPASPVVTAPDPAGAAWDERANAAEVSTLVAPGRAAAPPVVAPPAPARSEAAAAAPTPRPSAAPAAIEHRPEPSGPRPAAPAPEVPRAADAPPTRAAAEVVDRAPAVGSVAMPAAPPAPSATIEITVAEAAWTPTVEARSRPAVAADVRPAPPTDPAAPAEPAAPSRSAFAAPARRASAPPREATPARLVPGGPRAAPPAPGAAPSLAVSSPAVARGGRDPAVGRDAAVGRDTPLPALPASTTVVEVSIGRIEVRMPPSKQRAGDAPTAPRGPAVGLDEYLRRRDAQGGS